MALGALALALLLAAPAEAQRGLLRELGADLGPRRAAVLRRGTSGGTVRVLVASRLGQQSPLLAAPVPGRSAVLESLTFFGPLAAAGRLRVDGGALLEPVATGPAWARYEPDQALAPGALGGPGVDGRVGASGRVELVPDQSLAAPFQTATSGFQAPGSWAGVGWRLGKSGPGWAPRLPPFKGVLRFEPKPEVAEVHQFSGFETGDLIEFVPNGGVSVQGAVVRSGNHALRSQAVPGQVAYATLLGLTPDGSGGAALGIDDLHLSLWVRVAASSGRVRLAEVGGTSGATKLRLELEPDGRLSTEEHGLTRRFGQTVLAQDTWYHVRLRVGTGNATAVELLVNGAVEVFTESADTSSELAGRVHIGRSSSSGGASDLYFDDVIVAADAYPRNARVELLRSAIPGSSAGWSGSFAEVSDWPHDGDGSFRAAPMTGGSAFTCGLDSAAGLSGDVLAVKALAVLRRGAGPVDSALRVVSGGATTDTAAADSGPSYALRARVLIDDPATGGAWTLGAVDALQVGAVQLGSSSVTRATAVGASVLHVPPGN